MAPRGEEQKQEIIERLVALVRERLPAEEAPVVERFLRRYYRDVAPFDLEERDPADLYGAALALFRFGQQRKPGAPRIRAYNPRVEQHGWQSTHTILEIVNDDMPFLVDSVGMELNRLGLGVHLVIHPVVKLRRDARGRLQQILDRGEEDGEALNESWMHWEVDRHSDRAFLRELEREIARVLGDVRKAVEDWLPMRERIDPAIEEMRRGARWAEEGELEELEAFLRWLADDHFTFLGFAQYTLLRADGRLRLRREPGSGLGILRDYGDSEFSRSFDAMPEELKRRAVEPRPLLGVTKANSRSTVHRPVYLDYIGVKRYDRRGRVIGENRFLGLFTSAAYNRSPLYIPLLRRKIRNVLARAGFDPRSHAGKALTNILETYPRDELFQAREDELFEIATNILYLQDRQRVRLFLREDPFGRFVSALVYVPRERYTTALRLRFESLLRQAFGASEVEYQTQVSEAVLARILFILRTPAGIPEVDAEALERALVEAARDWTDQLEQALLEALGEERGTRLFRRYGRAFPVAYREAVAPRAAVADIVTIDRLARRREGEGLELRLYRRLEDPETVLRLRLVRRGGPVHLSDALPILENIGVRVLFEQPFEVRRSEGPGFWIHDFTVALEGRESVDVDQLHDRFRDLFLEVWAGRAENDGFNRLVLTAGLAPGDIVVLRAYCKYLLQIGTPFSQRYIERTLAGNPEVACALVELFRRRFDPDLGEEERRRGSERAVERILALLDRVQILDEDRILRGYLGLVRATLRTNVFRDDPERDHVALKFDPRLVPGMPLPRPQFEIFVYAPWMEGVHLRGGKVARGGIRWSDRREDFRTEILGLMKAQMVKNAVIVPTGAKGGFIVKRPPEGDRQALLEEGIRCYRTLIRGLLDVTDNRRGEEVVPPPRVVRYDDDDPYLVVAADKGTASFSDIANAISAEYGFWLGDAFASGGSAGYDHKKMGITARGAWESVKRHFRELGIDPAEDTFTVVGIGDMSGDVFGNGMLLSDRIRLIGAFDHRHIFLDPDPDPAVSYAERRRLFALPRSSWDDYDRSRISRGGGVWPRTIKRITLSPEARRALDIEATALTPNELVQAILKAPVDLLWNGGIGTFVKAREESHADAQDRTNDAVRVDAEDLRCKVVAEGGNLGLTQRARIAFARKGGRINTDFIDNSAGVDCSDHEVNIKILLGDVVESGELTIKQRNQLLAAMTAEVADLVLADNRLQNLALSVGQCLGVAILDAQERLMRKLERQGRLDRALEFLPSSREIARLRREGRGLTRPEAAVLFAYAKMALEEDLLATSIPERAYFAGDLTAYFPSPLRQRFASYIERHRLRREIVATTVANDMINRGLEIFVSELEDETGASLEEIALGYVIARDALDLAPLWSEVESLGREVPSERQLALFVELREALARGTRWFLAHGPRPLGIRDAVGRFRGGVCEIGRDLESVLPEAFALAWRGTARGLEEAGVPAPLAQNVASLPFRLAALDIVDARARAEQQGILLDAEGLARLFFAIAAQLQVDWLRSRLRRLPFSGRWDRLAATALEDEIPTILRRLAVAAAREIGSISDPAAAAEAVQDWLEGRVHGVARYRALLEELQRSGEVDLAMLSVAVRTLSALRSMPQPAAARAAE